MIRIFTETPEILLPRQHIKIIGDITNEIKDGDVYIIEKTRQVIFEVPIIVPPPGTTAPYDMVILDLSNTDKGLKLYPEKRETMYEILIGMKGSDRVLTYISYKRPEDIVFGKLEKVTMRTIPDPTNPLRYLYKLTVHDSPYLQPKLRIHTFKDMQPIYLVLLNDDKDNRYQKVVFRFFINLCKIRKVDYEPDKYRDIVEPETNMW